MAPFLFFLWLTGISDRGDLGYIHAKFDACKNARFVHYNWHCYMAGYRLFAGEMWANLYPGAKFQDRSRESIGQKCLFTYFYPHAASNRSLQIPKQHRKVR